MYIYIIYIYIYNILTFNIKISTLNYRYLINFEYMIEQ